MYCAAGELPVLILSISSFVILVFTDISTGVQTIFFHCARNTMRAASGSNQRLNSWRGGVANAGSAACRLRLAPMNTESFAGLGTCRATDNARDQFERRPPSQ